MNYYEYMTTRYISKESPSGDLARDMQADDDFPSLTEQDLDADKKTISEYLHQQRACDGCMAAFRKTWSNYRAYKRTQKGEQKR